jgi:hypothetical protein
VLYNLVIHYHKINIFLIYVMIINNVINVMIVINIILCKSKKKLIIVVVMIITIVVIKLFVKNVFNKNVKLVHINQKNNINSILIKFKMMVIITNYNVDIVLFII